MRLEGSYMVNSRRSDRHHLLVIAYTLTDWSSGAVKGTLSKLVNLLRTVKRSDIVISIGDMNASVVQLS